MRPFNSGKELVDYLAAKYDAQLRLAQFKFSAARAEAGRLKQKLAASRPPAGLPKEEADRFEGERQHHLQTITHVDNRLRALAQEESGAAREYAAAKNAIKMRRSV